MTLVEGHDVRINCIVLMGVPQPRIFWTKDGKPKQDPTPVLLNSWIGKSGPTFCPDCGRLVVGHNPIPGPNSKPPPTKADYEKNPAGGRPAPGEER